MEYTKELSDKLKNAKSKEEVFETLGRTDFSKLSMDELENVSGGAIKSDYMGTGYAVPATHEEIDAKWDVIDAVLKAYGRDVAWIVAAQFNCVAEGVKILDEYGTGVLRDYMHRRLDGKAEPWEKH
ncbi:MAG: hypothetical protein J5574_00225 [Lachnospiraceae bacterium]|nr:hypothetical protein [Lachnospiraceae bacterium]